MSVVNLPFVHCHRYQYATQIGAINASLDAFTDWWFCHECKAFHVGHRPWARKAA